MFSGLCLSACASISDRYQYLPVVTPSSETKIYSNGELVGEGTSTVRIVRKKKSELVFDTDGKKKNFKLKSKYRWGHSFGGNALLFYYAPIGWLIDYFTGAAWEVQPPKTKAMASLRVDSTSKILILPTVSDSSYDSLQFGKQVDAWIKDRYPSAKVVPFEEGYSASVVHGFDNEYSGEGDEYDEFSELLNKTQATHLVFSKFDDKKKQIDVRVFNPYAQKLIALYTIKDYPRPPKESSTQWVMRQSFNLLPNTFLVGLANTSYSGCSYSGADMRYCAINDKKTALSFLSSFSFTNILHYRKRDPWRLYLRFYPDFSFSLNEVEFSKQDRAMPDLNFTWHYLSVGYGARLSFIIPIGELFISVHPFWAMNYMRTYNDSVDKTVWTGRPGTAVQLGLNSWFSNRWNMRLYMTGYNQDIEMPALRQVDPAIEHSSPISILQMGLAIGYYFNDEKIKATRYLLK